MNDKGVNYDVNKLRGLLPHDLEVLVFDTIDSTNLEAKRRIQKGDTITSLLLTRHQSAGKGRLGREFYSPKDNGVYMSIVYPVMGNLLDAVAVTSVAAVCVMQAILKCTGKKTEIKWVNDLYYKNKKVCGILTEAVTAADGKRYIIVGIGINLYDFAFEGELCEIAASLKAECDASDLVLHITKKILSFAQTNDRKEYMREYRENSMVLGKTVTCIRGDVKFSAIAEEITDNGWLLVRDADGNVHTLDSGEVSLRF